MKNPQRCIAATKYPSHVNPSSSASFAILKNTKPEIAMPPAMMAYVGTQSPVRICHRCLSCKGITFWTPRRISSR